MTMPMFPSAPTEMRGIRALSLTQPYAWAILYAGKRIENRSRSDGRMPDICRHRGPLLLHAAKGMTRADYEGAADFMIGRGLARTKHGTGGLPVIPPRLQDVGDEMLPRGCIVGRAVAVDQIMPSECSDCGGSGDGRDGPLGHCAECLGKGVLPLIVDDNPISGVLDQRWWMGGHALILDHVAPLPWLMCRGALGLWAPPDDILEKVYALCRAEPGPCWCGAHVTTV